mmetsp:Transcript_33966/g.73528  ORF Transcript_33966/g.73528 Transcript_33966/m.73528 type:complete len:208 (-) Transcript_33966:9-632(-)
MGDGLLLIHPAWEGHNRHIHRIQDNVRHPRVVRLGRVGLELGGQVKVVGEVLLAEGALARDHAREHGHRHLNLLLALVVAADVPEEAHEGLAPSVVHRLAGHRGGGPEGLGVATDAVLGRVRDRREVRALEPVVEPRAGHVAPVGVGVNVAVEVRDGVNPAAESAGEGDEDEDGLLVNHGCWCWCHWLACLRRLVCVGWFATAQKRK